MRRLPVGGSLKVQADLKLKWTSSRSLWMVAAGRAKSPDATRNPALEMPIIPFLLINTENAPKHPARADIDTPHTPTIQKKYGVK